MRQLKAIKQKDGMYIVVDENGYQQCVQPYFFENGEWKFTPIDMNTSYLASDEDHIEALRIITRKLKLEKLLS